MRFIICFLFCLTAFFGMAQTSTYQKLWETNPEFQKPSAVTYDVKNNVYYVANQSKTVLDSGYDFEKDGFISKVSPKGEIITLKWIEGLMDPFDVFVKDNLLYIADSEVLVIADIAQGKVIKQVSAKAFVGKDREPLAIVRDDDLKSTETSEKDIIPPPPPPEINMLSCLAGSPDGSIFVSDYGCSAVYQWKNNKLTLLVRDSRVRTRDNIIWDYPTSRLWVLNFDLIYALSPTDKSMREIAVEPASPLTGIARMQDSYLLINSFEKVFQFKGGELTPLFQGDNECGCHTDIEYANGEIVILNAKLNKLTSYKRQ